MSRALVLLLLSGCVPVGGFDGGVPQPVDAGARDAGALDAGALPGWRLEDFAGTGVAGLKDGPLATAQFNGPTALAIDVDGLLYVADTGNKVIRKIDLAGNVSTISQPIFVEPLGVAVDARGVVYVADTREQCVRAIDPSGAVRTFAGTCAMGQVGFHTCYDSSPGTVGDGDIAAPMGLAADADAGVVYIADSEHQLVRFAAMRGRLLGSLAGKQNTTSYRDGPCGRNYCCGTQANTVIPDCRAANSAYFRNPVAVALGADGALLVADKNNCAIRLISTPTAMQCAVSTVFGGNCSSGAPLQSSLNQPLAVAAAPDGAIFVSDSLNHRVVKLDPSQPLLNRLEELPGRGTLSLPWGLAVANDGTGRVFVVDSGNHRIRVLNPP